MLLQNLCACWCDILTKCLLVGIDEGAEVDLNYYCPLFNTAKHGDWESAKRFIEHDHDALTAVISIHK